MIAKLNVKGQKEHRIEAAFGLYKATQTVSLEEMEQAIPKTRTMQKHTPEEILIRARALRQKTAHVHVTDELLMYAKNEERL